MKPALILFALSLLFFSEAKYVSKKITSSEPFVYLSKFCYDTRPPAGTMMFTATTKQAANLSIVTYFDGGSWSEVYGTSLSCEEKVNKSSSNTPFLSDSPQKFNFFDYTRAHYWYIALANCKKVEYEIEFHILFTQGVEDWNQQFSYDEEFLELIYILFSIVFVVGFAVHLYGDYLLIRSRSFHPIIRLLTISILLELLSLWAYMIHYVIYSKDGVGNTFLHTMGNVLDNLACLIFMFLLILIAKGWGITYPAISHIQDQKLILFGILGIFLILYIVLFFWGLFGVDPAVTLYIYQSIPGILFLIVRSFTLIYFVYCVWKTLREDNDSEKRSFYVTFGIGYGFWFLTLPLIVLIALGIPIWMQYKIVVGIYLTVTTFAYGAICFLLWPTRASKYFQVAVPDLLSTQYERL